VYQPEGHHLWDFWFVWNRGACHLFYLQAPKSLPPDERHWSATVGHAISHDLVRWAPQRTALEPGPPGAWDDLAIWTGHVIRHGEGFAMLYTGINRAERGRVQRIGLATSVDLQHWAKHPDNPVLEADLRWYEAEDASPLGTRAWRDPFVFPVPHEGRYRALITARLADGPLDRRGCLALARSADLVEWTVEPPFYAPGEFFHLEIPQLITHGGRSVLIFSVENPANEGDDAVGTCFRVAEHVTGAYRAVGHGWLLKGPLAYGAKLVSRDDGRWQALYWRYRDASGRFRGGLADPVDVRFRDDGAVHLIPPPA